MKRKGVLIFTFFMLTLNTLCFLYVDSLLKQEVSIYVLQIGRYKDKENMQTARKQLEDLKTTSYVYQDKEYVVIQDIYIKKKQAHDKANELAKKGVTCVVKEYFIEESYLKQIKKKAFKKIYPFLKQVDTK